jgi:hypothetical protein
MNLAHNAAGLFSHIVIDACGQMSEYETLHVMSLAAPSARVMLFGDCLETPASGTTDISPSPSGVSLISRLSSASSGFCHIKLLRSYHFNSALVSTVSELFYGGTLSNACLIKEDPPGPSSSDQFPACRYPIAFVNVNNYEPAQQHCYAEAMELVRQLTLLMGQWPARWGAVVPKQVVVLAETNEQAQCIHTLLQATPLQSIAVC